MLGSGDGGPARAGDKRVGQLAQMNSAQVGAGQRRVDGRDELFDPRSARERPASSRAVWRHAVATPAVYTQVVCADLHHAQPRAQRAGPPVPKVGGSGSHCLSLGQPRPDELVGRRVGPVPANHVQHLVVANPVRQHPAPRTAGPQTSHTAPALRREPDRPDTDGHPHSNICSNVDRSRAESGGNRCPDRDECSTPPVDARPRPSPRADLPTDNRSRRRPGSRAGPIATRADRATIGRLEITTQGRVFDVYP